MVFIKFYCSAPLCPEKLQKLDNTGTLVGCLSACAANLTSNQQDSPDCCTGSHSTNATCPSTNVTFYSNFKNLCPNSYVYAFDLSGIYTCDSSNAADYTLTFCPGNLLETAPTKKGAGWRRYTGIYTGLCELRFSGELGLTLAIITIMWYGIV